jgi:hypothetical protein
MARRVREGEPETPEAMPVPVAGKLLAGGSTVPRTAAHGGPWSPSQPSRWDAGIGYPSATRKPVAGTNTSPSATATFQELRRLGAKSVA